MIYRVLPVNKRVAPLKPAFPLKVASDFSGKPVKNVVFPDLRNTNAKISVYPDKWRLSARNFARNLDRIMDRIAEIFKAEKEIYILAPNLRKAGVIQSPSRLKYEPTASANHLPRLTPCFSAS